MVASAPMDYRTKESAFSATSFIGGVGYKLEEVVNINKGKETARRKKVTLADIRSKYPEEKKSVDVTNPLGFLIWRRFSYYLAWVFIQLGISANKVTAIAIIIGCIGCIFLASGDYWIIIGGALLILLQALFDYVDGNVARYNNCCTKYGSFLDTMHAYIITALLPIGIGIGLFNHPDSSLDSLAHFFMGMNLERSVYLIMGILASYFSLFTYLVSDRLALNLSMQPNEIYGPATTKKGNLWSVIYKMGLALENINGIMMVVLLLAAIFEFLSIFLLLWFVITACGFIAILARTLMLGGNLE